MKKEIYNKLDIESYTCGKCNSVVIKGCVPVDRARLDGTLSSCNKCSYIKRNPDCYKSDVWERSDIDLFLDLVFNKGISIMNTICQSFPSASIEKLIDLYNTLHLFNKKMKVETDCDMCGSTCLKSPTYYKSNYNKFCSKSCYYKHKAISAPKGAASPFYKRVSVQCDTCGSDMLIIPYNASLENSLGEINNFCSRACYWKFRRRYYVGDRAYWTNKTRPVDTVEKIKRAMARNSKRPDRLETGIQIAVNEILDDLAIAHDREHAIGYYNIDNYLSDYNLCIEVMGDYWHVNPNKYNKEKYSLTERQGKFILHDKQKIGYLLSHGHSHPLFLWEYDINKRLGVCRDLILKFISNNGVLEDYNSFNYSTVNNSLMLNSFIVVPYQYMNSSEYKALIKNKAA